MRHEAGIFLAIIYYDFERDTKMAVDIMKKLYEKFPNNPYIISQYVEYLLCDGQYAECHAVNKQMVKLHKSNSFIVMKGIIVLGILEEKYYKNYDKALTNYKLGVKIGEKYGAQADDFMGYAYFGLSRLAEKDGDLRKSKNYLKQAKSYNRYDHFIE